MFPVNLFRSLSLNPNNTGRDIWRLKKQDIPDKKKYSHVPDVSRLCSLIALRNMSGKLPDSTTFSVRE